MTPREFWCFYRGFKEQRKEELENSIYWQRYFTAWLYNAQATGRKKALQPTDMFKFDHERKEELKKIPSLSDLQNHLKEWEGKVKRQKGKKRRILKPDELTPNK